MNIQGLSYKATKPLRKEMQIVFQDPFGSLLVRPFSRTQAVERTIRGTVESSGVRIGHNQIMEVGEI